MSDKVDPSYSEVPATNLAQSILAAFEDSQKQAFVQEINELSENVKFTLSCAEQIHALLKREDAAVNLVEQYDSQTEEWDTANKNYKEQIRLIQEAARNATLYGTSTQILNRSKVFVDTYAPIALKDNDTEVLTAFVEFSKVRDYFSFFGLILNVLQTPQELDDIKDPSKLRNARAYDKDIKKLDDDIAANEARIKVASDTIERLIPAVFKKYGLNGRSQKLALMLGTSPVALVSALKDFIGRSDKTEKEDDQKTSTNKDDDSEKESKKSSKKSGNKKTDDDDIEELSDKDTEEISEGTGEKDDNAATNKKQSPKKPKKITGDHLDKVGKVGTKVMKKVVKTITLWEAADEVEECETAIKGQRQSLQTLLYKQEQAETNQRQWNVLISKLNDLGLRILFLGPKLKTIAVMAQSVKADVDSHVAFLQGQESQDPAGKEIALAEIRLASGMYKLMKEAYETFYIGVAASGVGVSP
ncbi:hypothetical protein BDP27DRAFT_1502465 [Rhodocollybia butyracea]|uniref:Uncharacterized protein n=1 Tax=Rhodocollybia butyracea TaxID=206335 RepID=A0A9P5P8A8_9AGAR|nr:hypothetical protein BDP27DRAFT_1502465 [Rhodocollybia butyracea]